MGKIYYTLLGVIIVILLASGCVKERIVYINLTPGANESMEVGEEEIDITEGGEDLDEEEGGFLNVITIKEGDLLRLNVDATDPDGNSLEYNFGEPVQTNGTWQTKRGDAGNYTIRVSVSDGKSETTGKIMIVVLSINTAPMIKEIGPIVLNEGDKLTLEPIVTDAQGDNVTITYSGWMTSNEYTTNYTDSGEYTVTITVSDGELSNSIEVDITINDVNRAPFMQEIAPVKVNEGDVAQVYLYAEDLDGDPLTVEFSGFINSTGAYATKIGDAGIYTINVTASDGKLSTVKQTTVTIIHINKVPVIETIAPIVVDEGDTIKIEPVVSDLDGDQVNVKYSGWMTSNEYKTDYDDSGQHKVTVTASDGESESSVDVEITVNDVNRPPSIINITAGGGRAG